MATKITMKQCGECAKTASVDLFRRRLENTAPSVSKWHDAHCHAVTRAQFPVPKQRELSVQKMIKNSKLFVFKFGTTAVVK